MEDTKMNAVDSVASEIVPASEVDYLDYFDKFSALTQAHLRDTHSLTHSLTRCGS